MSHILVVDDDVLTRRLLKDVLEKLLKHVVHEAADLRGALSRLKDGTFDLMFLDQHLPDGTVLDFCHTLDQMDSHRKTPKWIITGQKPLENDSVLLGRLGVAGYLVKPIEIDHIIRITDQCLKKSKR